MEDEEDDVFEPDPHCWRTTFKEIKCEERATQAPGPVPASNNGMLPCGVAGEPRPLFYGNAGFRLHFPAHFELGGEQEERLQESDDGMEQQLQQQQQQQQPVARSVEACVGQKLQLIGDQFHREHLQLYHRNQRIRGLLWWRLATAVLGLLFDRGFLAGRGGARRSLLLLSDSAALLQLWPAASSSQTIAHATGQPEDSSLQGSKQSQRLPPFHPQVGPVFV